jgi:hypothetical protein
MASDMSELRDAIGVIVRQLLEERHEAAVAGETAKVTAAETEIDRLQTIEATIQFAINNDREANLNAIAERLQESIEAQRAIGLKSALKSLSDTISRLRDDIKEEEAESSTSVGELRAKPGLHQAVVSKLIAGAKDHGLDPMTVLTIVAIESDFKPSAVSPRSTAGGLFQFLDSTWTAAGGKQIPGRGGIGNGHAAGASIDDQVRIGCKFIAENAKKLETKFGTRPSVVSIYMAHQQGLGGAMKILAADPNEAIESVIGVAAASNNAFDGLTVAQTIAKFRTMVRSNKDEARAVVMAGPSALANGGAENEGTGSSGSKAAKAVEVALSEMETFARRGGATLVETQEPLATRVLEYFKFVGRPEISSPDAEPWSAAYISFVLHQAGATSFPKSAGHFTYILAGLANRMANRFDAPVVYFDRDEKAPRVGDLIGFSRTASVTDRADIEAHLPDKFFPSHTDLVIDVSPGKIKVIGGNVSQTIKTTTVRADGEGKIDPSAAHFFVLRLNS